MLKLTTPGTLSEPLPVTCAATVRAITRALAQGIPVVVSCATLYVLAAVPVTSPVVEQAVADCCASAEPALPATANAATETAKMSLKVFTAGDGSATLRLGARGPKGIFRDLNRF